MVVQTEKIARLYYKEKELLRLLSLPPTTEIKSVSFGHDRTDDREPMTFVLTIKAIETSIH